MITPARALWHARRFFKAVLIVIALGMLGGVLTLAVGGTGDGWFHEDTRAGIGHFAGGCFGFALSYLVDRLRYTDLVLRLLGGLGIVHHITMLIYHFWASSKVVGWSGLGHFLAIVVLVFTSVTPLGLFLASFVRVSPEPRNAQGSSRQTR